jgi:serine/threonine-protein kinase haspin
MDHSSHGVTATIIDLGLARMDAGDDVHWTPFDELTFEGEGERAHAALNIDFTELHPCR